MALAHAILATLRNNAYSGYDLWKQFTECTNHYWKASQQQVYRELNKLEAQGSVVCELIPQEGRPDKKLYRVTKQGQELLIAWIGESSEPMAVREELLVKVFAASLVSPEVILKELERRRQMHGEKLSACQAKEQECFANPAQLSWEDRCIYLTLRRGIRYETEWVAWCEEAIAMFKQKTANKDNLSNIQ